MKITEYKEVTQRKEVTIGYKCDSCGKIHNGSYKPDNWHSFSGSHGEWGNDSIDSFKYYMVCSAACYVSMLNVAIKEYDDYNSAQIDYFTIEFAKELQSFIKLKER